MFTIGHCFTKKGTDTVVEKVAIAHIKGTGALCESVDDFLIELSYRSFVAWSGQSVFDVIAVVPLFPGEVMELD